MSARLNAYYNLEQPRGAVNTQLQFTIQCLFPRS